MAENSIQFLTNLIKKAQSAPTPVLKRVAQMPPLPPKPAVSLPIDLASKEMERTGQGTTVLSSRDPRVNIDRGSVASPNKAIDVLEILGKYPVTEGKRIYNQAKKLYDTSAREGELPAILKEGPMLAKNVLWDAPIGAVGAGIMGGMEAFKGTPLQGPSEKVMNALSFLPEKARQAVVTGANVPLIPKLNVSPTGQAGFVGSGPTIQGLIGESNVTAGSEMVRDLLMGGQFGALAKGAIGAKKRIGDADYREAFTKTAFPEIAPLFYGGTKGPSTSFAGTIPGGKQISQFVDGLVKGEGALNKVDPLLQEAKKYKSADKFIESQKVQQVKLEGAMDHRPSKMGRADNIEKNAPDFYEHPEYYNFHGKEYLESIQVLQRIKDKPNAKVTIYRASPKNELRTGDWVTFSKEKAKIEAQSENVPIQKFTVTVKDLQFAGDDITEFGYWGHSTESLKQLQEIYNQAHGKTNSTSSTMYGGIPGMQGVSRVVGGLIEGEKTLRDKIKNVSTDLPTRALPKNQKELVAEANSMGVSLDEMKDHLKGQYDEILNDEIKYLQDSSKQGVQQGGLVRDAEGVVVNRFGRQSNNPQWYRDFFAENGRAPNQKELAQIAIQNLVKGSGDVPKNDFFIELKNKLDNIEGIKNATIFEQKNENTPEVQYANNIKMKNIGSSDDARSIINLNAERFKNADITPQGDPVSLKSMQQEALQLAESTGMNKDVLERWAQDSVENRSKLVATRQALSDTSEEVAKLVVELQARPDDLELKNMVQSKVKEMQYIQAAANRIVAESGRTLAANKIKTLEHDARRIEKYIQDNLSKDPTALTDMLSNIPIKDLPDVLKKMTVPSVMDRVMSFRQAMLLTDPRTHIKNVFGNTAGLTVRKLEQPLMVLADKVVSFVQGKQSSESFMDLLPQGKYKRQVLKGDLAKWIEKYADDQGKFDQSAMKSTLPEKGADIVFKLLEVEDNFFKNYLAKDSIVTSARKIARSEGLKGKDFEERVSDLVRSPTDDMFQDMAEEALRWTYQKTPKSQAYKYASDFRKLGGGLGKIPLPFLKTVWNLFDMAYERTLPGQWYNLLKSTKLGGNKNTPQQAIKNLLFATAVQGVVSSLYESGNITGSTTDPRERATMQAEGLVEDSIKTPFGTFSYRGLEPASLILGSSVDFHKGIKDIFVGNMTPLESTANVLATGSSRFLDNPFIQGVSDLVYMLNPQFAGKTPGETAVKNVQEFGKKQIASFYPRGLNWLEETLGEGKMQRPETLSDFFMASTPGLSKNVPVKVDLWGNEVKKQQVTNNPVINQVLASLVPMQIENKKNDPVNKELLRLKYFPTVPSRKIDGYEMNNREYEQYAKVTGKEAKLALDQLVASKEYQEALDNKKIDMLKKTISTARAKYKDMFAEQVAEEKIKQAEEANKKGNVAEKQDIIQDLIPQEKKTIKKPQDPTKKILNDIKKERESKRKTTQLNGSLEFLNEAIAENKLEKGIQIVKEEYPSFTDEEVALLVELAKRGITSMD